MAAHVFCPTDYSTASHVAFEHALALAFAFRGKLTLMHVAADSEGKTGGFPGYRAQLERWGRLPAGSSDSAVAGLGITVEKVIGRVGDPVEGVLRYLAHHPADLVVLSTHQREGTARWSARAVAEPIARDSRAMTLFLPHTGRGFVSATDGAIQLSRILIPVVAQPAPQPAVDAAIELLKACGISGASLTVFHAGAESDMPAVKAPTKEFAAKITRLARPGDPVEQILAAARETAAELVIMSTAGHDGILDALRGSTTERVLRQLNCPLLAVPALPADGAV